MSFGGLSHFVVDRSLAIIEIFCAIICAQNLDFCLELGLNHGMKIYEHGTNINFFLLAYKPDKFDYDC